MRPFASHSKKRTQAVAEEALRDPRPGEWRVRLADGRHTGCLPPALRSPLSPSLSGRNLEAIARRRAQTAADETRPGGAGGLRVRAGRRPQSVLVVRAIGQSAARG